MANWWENDKVVEPQAGGNFWEKDSIAGAPSQKKAAPWTVDPTEGMSDLQLLGAGAGKFVADLGRGAGQYLGMVSRDDVAESRKRDAALMRTTPGVIGNVLGGVLGLAPTAMIPGANTLAGSALIGGITGAAQPSVNDGETLGNIGAGAAGGAIGQKIGSWLGGKMSAAGAEPMLTEGQRAAAQGGRDLGMRMTPGQASGSRALQRVEASLESNPITSGGFDAIKMRNQQVLNNAAARSFGEKTNDLSPAVLERANQRMGDVFNRVKTKDVAKLGDDFLGTLVKAIDDSDGLIGGNSSLADNPLVKRAIGFNDRGVATLEQLRELSSKMGKAASNNMTTQSGDRELGKALFAVKNSVDDAIEQNLAPELAKEFAKARGQYRSYTQLMLNNVLNPSSGNISGRNLAGRLQRTDRAGFSLGKNDSDMYKAARFYQAFPSIVGDSGTATRSAGAMDWLLSIPGGVASSIYTSRPVTGALSGGIGATRAIEGLLSPVPNYIGAPAGTMGGLLGLEQWAQ
jgi:hypothetical protein